MSQAEYQAASYTGPRQGKIAALAFTTSSEGNVLATVLSEDPVGKFITMISTVAVYFAFADSAANALNEATLDTAGSTAQCILLPANTFFRCKPTGGTLMLKGSEGGNIRIWVSSY